MLRKVPEVNKLLVVLNFLNSTPFCFDARVVDLLKKFYYDAQFRRAFEHSEETAAANESVFTEFTFLQNKNFFFRHKLDRRTRIYVTNSPVNYQLNHLSRAVLRTVRLDIDLVCFNIEKNLDVEKMLGSFSQKNYLHFLAKARNFFNKINKPKFIPEGSSLKEKIFIESALNLFYRLGFSEKSEIKKIEQGFEVLQELYSTPLKNFLLKYVANIKKIEMLALFCSLSVWLNSNEEWPDIF